MQPSPKPGLRPFVFPHCLPTFQLELYFLCKQEVGWQHGRLGGCLSRTRAFIVFALGVCAYDGMTFILQWNRVFPVKFTSSSQCWSHKRKPETESHQRSDRAEKLFPIKTFFLPALFPFLEYYILVSIVVLWWSYQWNPSHGPITMTTSPGNFVLLS